MTKLIVFAMVFFCANLSLAQSQTQTQSQTDADGKFQVSSSFRFRVEGDEKTDFSTNRDYMPLRIRPEIRYNYDSTLSMVLTPQFAKVFGEPVYTLAPNNGTAAQQQTSGATTDSTFYVHEGYLFYKPVENVAFKPEDKLFLMETNWSLARLTGTTPEEVLMRSVRDLFLIYYGSTRFSASSLIIIRSLTGRGT